MKRRNRTAEFFQGVLIGLAILTPVFVASSPTVDHWTGLLCVAALFLVVVGVLLHVAGRAPTPGGALRAQRIDGRQQVIRDRE